MARRMNAPFDTHAGALRFERVAITCVFGDPRDLKSWSGAPANLARSSSGSVRDCRRHSRRASAGWRSSASRACDMMAASDGRSARSRCCAACARGAASPPRSPSRRAGLAHATCCIPGPSTCRPADLGAGVKHYLYCDHWPGADARPSHRRAAATTKRALTAFDQAEREAPRRLARMSSPSAPTSRDNLIAHYGLPRGEGHGRRLGHGRDRAL